MNYADLKWSLIQEWNSDAKFSNEYLIEMGAEAGVEIKNAHADRKSIIAKIADGMVASGVESGEYVVDGSGEGCDNDLNFKRYMGDLTIPAPTLKFEDSNEHEHEDGTVHSHPHEGEHSHDEEVYTYEDEEEEEFPDFTKMTKKALDEWAADRGIELDRRKTKSNMISDLEEFLEV
jgi:hypothetical protein|tara:strand:- start:43 stop:570 length:528 start_codon:yes stop_codon:yes gene_type:complete